MFTVTVFAETNDNSGRKINLRRNFVVRNGLTDQRTPLDFVKRAFELRRDKGYPFNGETVQVIYLDTIYTFYIEPDADKPRFEQISVIVPSLTI